MKGGDKMGKKNKSNDRKGAAPRVDNDQLGENAYEKFAEKGMDGKKKSK